MHARQTLTVKAPRASRDSACWKASRTRPYRERVRRDLTSSLWPRVRVCVCVRVFLCCYTMSGWSLRWLRSETSSSSSRSSEGAEQGWAKDTIFIRIPTLSHGLRPPNEPTGTVISRLFLNVNQVPLAVPPPCCRLSSGDRCLHGNGMDLTPSTGPPRNLWLEVPIYG